MTDRQLLDRLCNEADRLRTDNDGIHDIHGYTSALHNWREIYEKEGAEGFLLMRRWNNVGRCIIGVRRLARGNKPLSSAEPTAFTRNDVAAM